MSRARPVTAVIRLLGTLVVLAAGLAALMFVTGAGKLPGGPYVASSPDRMAPENLDRLERAFSASGRDRQLDVTLVGFREEDGRDYVVVAADSRQGPVFLHARVLDWDPALRRLRDAGGGSGARLRGFAWDVATLGQRRELIYRGMESVAD